MTPIKSDIEHLKQTLLHQQGIFFMQLHECRLFTEGTCERILEQRHAEQKDLFTKLDKIKRSIPKRLLKNIDAYLLALNAVSRLNTAIAVYALDDTFCEFIECNQEAREEFIQAKQASMKAYRDLSKHLMLQKTLRDHSDEISCNTTRVMNLYRYVTNIHDSEKQAVVIEDIRDIERKQRSDKYKKIAGITLRVIGWGIMIAATVIGFNPAVSLAIMGLSFLATGFGELLNVSGKKLAAASVSQTQMSTVRDSLLFFKKEPPQQIAPNVNHLISNDAQHSETAPLLVPA